MPNFKPSNSKSTRPAKKNTVPAVKQETFREFKVSRVIPDSLAKAEIEPGTPIDLALGMNFLGAACYNSQGFDPGPEPALPEDITIKLLNSECQFFKGRREVDSHILALIPESLNGIPLTINSALTIMKPPYSFGSKKKLFCQDAPYANSTAGKSYWAYIPMYLGTEPFQDQYQRANARELFIAGCIYSMFAKKEIFFGRTAITTDVDESDGKERAITVTIFSGENKGLANINTITPAEIGNPRLFRGGYAFKRALGI